MRVPNSYPCGESCALATACMLLGDLLLFRREAQLLCELHKVGAQLVSYALLTWNLKPVVLWCCQLAPRCWHAREPAEHSTMRCMQRKEKMNHDLTTTSDKHTCKRGLKLSRCCIQGGEAGLLARVAQTALHHKPTMSSKFICVPSPRWLANHARLDGRAHRKAPCTPTK